jgi:glycosyltransferase involved in cell wall biosynthesis
MACQDTERQALNIRGHILLAPSSPGTLPFSPVRILLDYRPALRQRSGIGEYVHQLARALAGQRVDRSAERRAGDRRAASNSDAVEVFTSSWRDRPEPAAVADLGPAVRIVDRRIPVRLLNACWHRHGWPPVEWITGRSYDVVHSPGPMLMPSSRAAQVVTIHDLDFLLHPERARAEMRRTYPAFVRRHAAAADGIVVGCQQVADQVVELLHVDADRVSVCPYGVPRWTLSGPIDPGRPTGEYILFLGTLEPRKNIDGLLAAYADLCARRPDTPPLKLAGGSVRGAETWREAIGRPPLLGRVTYHGYVADADRQRLYEGARLFVLPSFNEGFGLPVVEAMSLGVPVVASNRGALPEVCGGAALLVNPEQVCEISAAMERVLFDRTLSGRLAEGGLKQAGHFTWERAADLTRAAYERALHTRRQRGD